VTAADAYTLEELLLLPLTWHLSSPVAGHEIVLRCDRRGCDGQAAVIHPGCALCTTCHEELAAHPDADSEIEVDAATFERRREEWRYQARRAYENGVEIERCRELDVHLDLQARQAVEALIESLTKEALA
jgi:hypothetical protein